MSPQDLKRGKGLEERATPGNWLVKGDVSDIFLDIMIENPRLSFEDHLMHGDYGSSAYMLKEDAELIVWLRNHAKELIEMAEKSLKNNCRHLNNTGPADGSGRKWCLDCKIQIS